jgi:hypothetical protein
MPEVSLLVLKMRGVACVQSKIRLLDIRLVSQHSETPQKKALEKFQADVSLSASADFLKTKFSVFRRFVLSRSRSFF